MWVECGCGTRDRIAPEINTRWSLRGSSQLFEPWALKNADRPPNVPENDKSDSQLRDLELRIVTSGSLELQDLPGEGGQWFLTQELFRGPYTEEDSYEIGGKLLQIQYTVINPAKAL